MSKREKWATQVADLAGRALRRLGRTTPGVLGPVLVCVGLGMVWLPVGVIAAGAVLWLLDWRMPDQAAVTAVRHPDGRLRAVS